MYNPITMPIFNKPNSAPKPGTQSPDAIRTPQPPGPKKTQEELRAVYSERLKSMEQPIKELVAIYEKNLKDGVFKDAQSEAQGSGISRRDTARTEIEGMVNRARAIKDLLDSGKEIPDTETNLMEAEALLGPLLIGPAELKGAFGWDISPQDIPPIPFTKEALEEAKAKGSYLILCIDKDPKTGAAITGDYIAKAVEPKLQAQNKGKLVNNPQPNEPFYTTETPRRGWMLTDFSTLPETKNNNYTQQTKLLRDELKTRKDLTQEEQQAIAQCTDQELSRLEALADELSALSINQLTRRRESEILYTMATLLLTRNKRHLEKEYDWGISRWASGGLACAGSLGSHGAYLLGGGPGSASANSGAVLSRRVS